MVASNSIYLLGIGTAFDEIAADQAAYAPGAAWEMRRAPSVSALAQSAAALLGGLPQAANIFIAVDSNAINFARLELYGPAKLRGCRLIALTHPTAHVAPDAKLGENVWVGPGASIGSGCKLGSDVLVNARARLDAGVQIGAHGWIGPGASIGAGTEIGGHCVVSADVRLGGGLQVGKHCVLTRPGYWTQSLPAGTFIEPGYSEPAHMIGATYSWQPRRP